MAGPDEVIHQSTRLKLMATLKGVPPGEGLEFLRLKAILGVTDGNLGTHLAALEKAGYVEIAKDFIGKKPRTRVSMSKAGRRAFEAHVAYLRDILDS
jgi:DNA-binding MarR family transcriptional regulator